MSIVTTLFPDGFTTTTGCSGLVVSIGFIGFCASSIFFAISNGVSLSPNITQVGVLVTLVGVFQVGLLPHSHPSPPPNHPAGAVGTMGNWKT